MKLLRRQKIWLAIVVVTNLTLWIIPSDVVEQIARDRPTMLGRYSRTHFAWIVGVLIISLISFYVDWSTGRTYKKRWFAVLASLLFLTPVVGVVDFLLRSPQHGHYVRDTLAYHRPPGGEFPPGGEPAVIKDQPEAHRTYPNAPPGYPAIDCRLSTDAWGFRNAAVPKRCDVVVLGDSFAEGSHVSDEHPWPGRLAHRSGMTVYNLGMSGYDPLHYRESLKQFGLKLAPRFVLCLLYEGNDFRSGGSDHKRMTPKLSKRIGTYFKQSPIVTALDNLLINTFGPINSDGPVKGVEILDWLPLAIPQGPGREGEDSLCVPRYYAFAPKQLRDMCKYHDSFATDRRWLNSRRHLEEMDRLCKEAGARFVVVYAPTKAHVTMPLAADKLDAKKVKAFVALRYKNLPGAEEVLAMVTDGAGARQAVVGEWCAEASIPYCTLTKPLRAAALAGRQVYFTYDQHWTPQGHEVVAEAVQRFLAELRIQNSERNVETKWS